MIHYIFLLLIVGIFTFIYISNKKHYEGLNENSGYWCRSCNDRTFGECSQCFNCGFLKDSNNTGKCVNGNLFKPDNELLNDKELNQNYEQNDMFWSMVRTENKTGCAMKAFDDF